MTITWRNRTRNRRFGDRPYVLDVKLRTRQMRVARWRSVGVGLGGIFTLALVVFAVWRGGEWVVDRAVYGNASFNIQHIEIVTDGVLSPNTIRQWAMVKTGENLLALDLPQIKRDLEAQPPIASVIVERLLPNTLRLEVSERQAVAQTFVVQMKKGGGFVQAPYDFDADGFVLLPLNPAWRLMPAPTNYVLPVLVGVPIVELQPGRQVESPQVHAALELIVDLDRSPMAGLVELQTISVASPEVLEATTTQGAHITFGLAHFDEQLARWRQIRDLYQQEGKGIASLDLSVSNNLPVRWVAANILPPLTHLQAKTVKPKKKNV